MSRTFPFRVELEFNSIEEYAPSRMRDDGLEFAEALENRINELESTFFGRTNFIRSKFLFSRLGSLIHCGVFEIRDAALPELLGDIAAAQFLVELVRQTIELHYQNRLERYDARVGKARSKRFLNRAPIFRRMRPSRQFQSFWDGASAPLARKSKVFGRRDFVRSEGQAIDQNSVITSDPIRNDIVRQGVRAQVYAQWVVLFLFVAAALYLRSCSSNRELELVETKLDLILLQKERQSVCCCEGLSVQDQATQVLEDAEVDRATRASSDEQSNQDLRACTAKESKSWTVERLGWGTVTTLPNNSKE